MTIVKDHEVVFRNSETDNITCNITFKTLDSNRKVHHNYTAMYVCELKRWIEVYNKKILPNLKLKNSDKFKQTKDWIDKWAGITDSLIPENTTIPPYKFSERYFVNLNDCLLEADNLLTYNQALFLLLGFNTHYLDYEPLKNMPTLNGVEPSGSDALFEKILWSTKPNKALKISAFVINEKITSKNLEKLAIKHGFFTNHNNYLENRVIDKGVATKLYKALKDANLITGEFSDLWQWEAKRNQLKYLAKQLKITLKLLSDICHVELASYIQDPKPDSNINAIDDPARRGQIVIDNFIKKIA